MQIAICDDDIEFAEKLKVLVENGLKARNVRPVISVFHDGTALVSGSQQYDAVFLDIDMPGMSGFDIAGQINGLEETLIVFVTLHDELVYSSIKFRPFRFIRKTHLENEISEVLSALEKTISKRNAGKRFPFQTKTGEVFLDVSNIEYIEVYGHWLHVCVEGSEDLECYGSLSDLEKQLVPFDFIRVHKSYLVNCRYIYSIEKGQVILDDKTEILLSRYRLDEVRNKFRNYIKGGL